MGVTRSMAIAAVDENAHIARQGSGIARDGDDHRHRGARQSLGLGLGAGARRIEYDRVETFQLLGRQRLAQQVAHFRLDRASGPERAGRRR